MADLYGRMELRNVDQWKSLDKKKYDSSEETIIRNNSNCCIGLIKGVSFYILKKLQELAGLRLTFVQDIYWRAVQRRMVMGQLERLVDGGKIKDYISYELAVSLMSGDKAIKKCLVHLCERKNILVLPPGYKGPPDDRDRETCSPDRLIDSTVIEEPDTGDIGIITHLQIKEVCNSMPRVEDEHNYLEDKGGFWDLALLAVKFLHAKRAHNDIEVDTIDSLVESSRWEESTDIFSDEDFDSQDESDIFFGKDLPNRYSLEERGSNRSSVVESTDGLRDDTQVGKSFRKTKRSLYELNKWNNHRRSRWQVVNDYIPLRVSNFQYRDVNNNRRAKLNIMWKKASRWPLFTYWVTFVQIAIVLITLSVYGFAPLRYTPYTERALVQQADLSVRVAEKNITPNIWAGPDRAALVLLGANYGPCMTRDNILQRIIDGRREQEAMDSGCCVRRDSSGCVQVLSSDDCPNEIGLADFITVDNSSEYNSSLYSNRTVCGTSPSTCTSPDPRFDSRWMSPSITEWPICTQSFSSHARHLSCRVTGRPCCVGEQANCIIASQEHCDFLEGYFHADAFLCSQVDCWKDICGLTPFGAHPDQSQRLGLALFLHAGIFHVLMTIIFNIYVLRDLEKYLGWLATASLYIGSGIGGNIVSALFVPYSAEVGPAAAMFGVISFFLVFITYHWDFFDRACLQMLKYCVLVILLFLVGLLPYVDNYARIGGFLFGIMFSFIHVHYIPQHQCVIELNKSMFQKDIPYPLLVKIILLVSGILIMIPLFMFCFSFFNLEKQTWEGFSYLNCIIPVSISNICFNFRQDISSSY